MQHEAEEGLVRAAGTVRGTQSLVHTLARCWHRPSWTLLEVAWRWLIGIPALLLGGGQLRSILAAHTQGTYDLSRLGLDRKLLNDPVGTAAADPLGVVAKWSAGFAAVWPDVLHVALWLVPVLLSIWIVISSFGRGVVLRRIDPTLHARPGTVLVLQGARITALAGTLILWFAGLRWVVATTVTRPIAGGEDPNLVLYFALNIVLSLGLFTLWAILSWVFSIAPLLAMLRDQGPAASLAAALRLGRLKGKLVEINLVMGIIKIALIVLAMVFSATPLPFESVTTPEFLRFWWAAVTICYFVASDFFHVARMVAYLELWRAYQAESSLL